ncbi:MAG: DUF4091 domain-containing protein [Armatimonadetes bacterium]|nr:DUF4091 domain-containing protein [Armatimonadota bacterium]
MTPAIVVLTMLLGAALGAQSPGSNLLRNPGFEAGGQAPEAWGLGMEGRGAGSARWESEGPHGGGRCVRVELAERGDYWMADQVLPARSASEKSLYRLTGWYRADKPNVAHPTVYSLDANGAFLGAFEFALPQANEWTLFDTLFRPKAGVDHFRLQLRVQGEPGVVWYDDVGLSEVGDAEGFAAQQRALAEQLQGQAAALSGWWCALVPTEAFAEFRLRGADQVTVAMALAGMDELPRGAFAGVEAVYQTLEGEQTFRWPFEPSQGLVRRTLDLREPGMKGWSGSVTLRLAARGVGPGARALVAIEPTPEVRRALVEGRLGTDYLSPAGEALPWGPQFLGDTAAQIAALTAENTTRHLAQTLGAKSGRAGIVALDGLTRRRPDEWREDVTSGRLEPTSTIELLCAGGEAESFQCLFAASSPNAGKLIAEMTPLRCKGNPPIPAEACKVRLVEYVPFAGKAWPDPLLEAQPFEPSKLGPPVFWVTVSVPEQQPTGLYTGELRMRAESGDRATAEVQVRVPGFALSKETHLNSSFWLFRGHIRHYFELQDEVPPEVYGEYIDLATSHRLSPIDVLEGPCGPLVTVYREADGSLSYDWARWDAYAKRAMDGGASTLHVAWTHWMGWFFSDRAPVTAIDRATGEAVKIAPPHNSEEHLRYLGSYLTAAAQHTRELGFKGFLYVQPYDEPQPDGYERVATTLAGLGQYAPGIPRLMDAVYPPALPQNLRSNIDLWCPLSPGIEGNEFEQEHAAGDIIWWYVCCGPRGQYANFFTNQSVLENRMLFTQTWQHHVTGVLYWGLNYWLDWGKPPVAPRFPNAPWRGVTDNEGAGYCGDGYFIYPGPAADQPLSSIRLETLRDGVEDYEYLYALNELARQKDVPEEVTRLLAVPPEVAATLTDFTRDPVVFRKYREAVAEWIERLAAGRP